MARSRRQSSAAPASFPIPAPCRRRGARTRVARSFGLVRRPSVFDDGLESKRLRCPARGPSRPPPPRERAHQLPIRVAHAENYYSWEYVPCLDRAPANTRGAEMRGVGAQLVKKAYNGHRTTVKPPPIIHSFMNTEYSHLNVTKIISLLPLGPMLPSVAAAAGHARRAAGEV